MDEQSSVTFWVKFVVKNAICFPTLWFAQCCCTNNTTTPHPDLEAVIHTPFIFFCRVAFSACRRRSSASTGLEAGLGAGAAPPPSFRPWFSCSSCSICMHSCRKQGYSVKESVWEPKGMVRERVLWRARSSACCSAVGSLPPDCGASPAASHSRSATRLPPAAADNKRVNSKSTHIK